ncbi:MAG: hypothetical protein M1817_000457 [Caeruleum heppii]|nr:MAG: hypothetical protein M1817_000457 [Caeruleum heppii]
MGGDSAGAGMIVSILVTLRDQGLPPPAGAILISPWVDLTHSFPSVAGDSPLDYVPAHGFLHKPSTSWPPPNCDDMRELEDHARGQRHGNAERPSHGHISLDEKVAKPETSSHAESAISGAAAPSLSNEPSIILDGEMIRIKDQIQIYTTNELVSHPLVSPILQPSLGGLPPLLVMTGGGEMLRDEQIYLAHKAANPPKYPPSETCLNENLQARETLARYQGTDVQLQVWEDLCHVAPTLSFTRPAKYMYRSIAQFGAWALARAQKTEIEIMYDDDDDISIISSGSESDAASATSAWKTRTAPALSSIQQQESITQIGKAGDPLPAFRNHMLRERVDRHGHIFPLAAPSELPALQLAPSEIGMIKEGPVRKWMHAKREWDIKFAREKRQVQKQRAKELAAGYELFGDGERPPPSALAARRRKDMPKEEKVKRSWGMSLWSLWGSSHDREILEREEKAHREPAKVLITPSHGGANEPPSKRAADRSRSRRRTVTDMGQTEHQSTEVLASALVPVESDTKHSKVGGSTSGVVSTSTKVEQ